MARKVKDDDDSDNAMDAATERAARELEAQAKEEKQGRRSDSDDPVVDLDEEPDDDEESAPVPGRDAKKASRWREHSEKREAAERRARELEEENRRLNLRADTLAELARGTRQPQEQGPSEIDKAIAEARAERDRVWDDFSAMDDATQKARFKEFKDRQAAAEEKYHTLIYKKSAGPQQPAVSPGEILLQSQFPDVVGHPRGRQVIRAHYDLIVARGGQHSAATLIQASNEARKELRTGPTASRDPSLKAKLTHSPGRGAGGPQERTQNLVELTKGDRIMARAKYPKLPEKEAFRLHAITKSKAMADD